MPRKKSSLFEDLYEIAVKLPWWAGLLLALISFVALHSVAQMEIAPSPPAEIGQNISRQLFRTFSSILQYLIPAIFCLGAMGSFFEHLRRQKLFDQIQKEQTSLSQISWQEFELLVGEAFRQKGYLVVETGSGADGGVDLVLTKNGGRFLVQCKHWKSSNKVSVMAVRELLGVIASQKADGGFLVASGGFTKDADAFAKQTGIVLVGREDLHKMIQSAKTSTMSLGHTQPPKIKATTAALPPPSNIP